MNVIKKEEKTHGVSVKEVQEEMLKAICAGKICLKCSGDVKL